MLQNSADPKPWSGSPGLGFLDIVHRQGAGMLDIDDAITSTTTISPGKLSLGEGMGGLAQTLKLSNGGGAPVTYDLSYDGGDLVDRSTFTPTIFLWTTRPRVQLAERDRAGEGGATSLSTIAPASGARHGQYGGYLVLTEQGGGRSTACRTPASRATTRRSGC